MLLVGTESSHQDHHHHHHHQKRSVHAKDDDSKSQSFRSGGSKKCQDKVSVSVWRLMLALFRQEIVLLGLRCLSHNILCVCVCVCVLALSHSICLPLSLSAV